MKEYLLTIVTATLAAWVLQHGAPPPPAHDAPPPQARAAPR